ncbi:MAG TPA: hypothetical protein VGS04_05385 [Nitrososphaerales archaeon]|nr:hypothetical protein [Nitrososphaerales archaeon]
MPTCPKCEKWISESHYQRHLGRCGTSHRHEPQSLYVPSATAQVESPDRGITYGPAREQRGRINWTKVMAAFVIFLLVGSVAVFFVLYALSLL